MQSRKQKDSVHSLPTDAEYRPRQSSSEVSLCRLESLKERHEAAWGRTDRQAIPHYSSESVWESQDHAQSHSNPSIPSPEVIAALALSLSAGQDVGPSTTLNKQGTAGPPGPLGCHLRPRARLLPYLGNSALHWVKIAEGSMQ